MVDRLVVVIVVVVVVVVVVVFMVVFVVDVALSDIYSTPSTVDTEFPHITVIYPLGCAWYHMFRIMSYIRDQCSFSWKREGVSTVSTRK